MTKKHLCAKLHGHSTSYSPPEDSHCVPDPARVSSQAVPSSLDRPKKWSWSRQVQIQTTFIVKKNSKWILLVAMATLFPSRILTIKSRRTIASLGEGQLKKKIAASVNQNTNPCHNRKIWVFPKMLVPNNHGFSYSKWSFWGVKWGYHHFKETPIYIHHKSMSQ